MKTLLAGSALALVAMAGAAAAQDAVSACFIVKTDTNPFFVKMREGAEAKAASSASSSATTPAASTGTTRRRSPPSRPASPAACRAS